MAPDRPDRFAGQYGPMAQAQKNSCSCAAEERRRFQSVRVNLIAATCSSGGVPPSQRYSPAHGTDWR